MWEAPDAIKAATMANEVHLVPSQVPDDGIYSCVVVAHHHKITDQQRRHSNIAETRDRKSKKRSIPEQLIKAWNIGRETQPNRLHTVRLQPCTTDGLATVN